LKKRNSLVLVHFNIYCFLSQEINVCMHSDMKCPNSSLIHLMGQPYCKRIDQQKDKDGIITYFLGTISLVDTTASVMFHKVKLLQHLMQNR
jgi:hypothetical protein